MQKLLAQLLSKYKSDIITTSTSHGDATSVCVKYSIVYQLLIVISFGNNRNYKTMPFHYRRGS